MSINRNLDIDPYFDDFDPENQYNRILFKPAFAVQARELTQLQTILQNQIERFGSNIYKEGTVIDGINLIERDDIFFVKLKDQSNFSDPTIYEPTEDQTYYVVGQSSGLRAEIVKAANGFQTRDPDLKTFFIKYLNTTESSATGDDIKQFEAGEVLSVLNKDGSPVTVTNTEGVQSRLNVTVSTLDNHVGRSFGISINEGVIFQRGHFIFVEPQFIIVSKYSNQPDDVSVGFEVLENIVTANQDPSLLDNAQGYNNENAPGADRLQLQPILTTFPTDSEPEEFFALARYQRGRAVRIRDVTEFNSISTEMARRTYEESGNYVVSGMDVSLEKKDQDVFAVVSPGKAYAFGYEVSNIANRYLQIQPSNVVQSKENQSTGVQYGQYYQFVWDQADVDGSTVTNSTLNNFSLDGTRYSLYDESDQVIGECSIRNVSPPNSSQGLGRIYVYAISKNSGEETTPVARIGDTPVLSAIKQTTKSSYIFDTGNSNLKSTSNVRLIRRIRQAVSGESTVEIAATQTRTPIANEKIYAVDSTNQQIGLSGPATYSVSSGIMTVPLDDTGAEYIYYDAIVEEIEPDNVEQVEMYARSVVSNGRAWLGVPNAVKILEVVDNNGDGKDVTSKFKLVNNQKDTFYDISYISLKTGQSVENNNLLIKFIAFRRTSNYGSGYLTVDSYDDVDGSLIKEYNGKDGNVYDLLSCFDFRPYVKPTIAYAASAESAEVASSPSEVSFPEILPISTDAFINYDYEYYLSRIDSVCVDSSGQFNIIKGQPDEDPKEPAVRDSFAISQIYVPGNILRVSGPNRVSSQKVAIHNYTMEDIEKIDKQVERLTETVALSLLETQTKDVFIPDEFGNNRFKNGILVDNFETVNVADLIDPEYKAAIDKSNRIASPAVQQFPVDLKLSTSTSNVNVGYSKVVTLADSNQGGTVNLIRQPFATTFRNAVSNFYNYSGQALIEPQFDSGYNVVANPDANFEIDLTETLSDFVDNLQEFIPLTNTQTERSSNTTSRRRGATTRITNETITNRITEQLTFDSVDSETQRVGSFVSDVRFRPFMQEREVKILVTGLRPNTTHYFFFDETDVNEHVYPGDIVQNNGELRVQDVSISDDSSKSVKSDSNGILAAVFIIPEQTFYVGSIDLEISDVDQYESIQSAGTSYSRVAYRAYNFGITKQDVSSTTRTLDFDVDTTVSTTRSVTNRAVFDPPGPSGPGGGGVGDPLSQTFFIKSGAASGASYVHINQLELFFKGKSETNGVTIEVREVENGYPSKRVLPFGSKHLTPEQISTSDDGSTATRIVFDNPVKCGIEKEYAIVVIPDANDPNYLLFTSKVGGTDLSTGVDITQDWGDGVLFTSTNNRAWKSYQDEDLKFSVNRVRYTEDQGYVDLIPNDTEFFQITDVVGRFRNDELVYTEKSSGVSVGLQDYTATIVDNIPGIAVNDYVLFEQGSQKFIAKVVSVQESSESITFTLDSKSTLPSDSTLSTTAKLVVAGRVSYFNDRSGDKLHLKASSARTNIRFSTSDQIRGFRSDARAVIDVIDNIPVSYMQPMIHVDNTIQTFTTFDLYKGSQVDRSISLGSNAYLTGDVRTIPSKSLVVDPQTSVENDFVIRVNMFNGGYQSVSPILDDDISMLHVYQYQITDSEDTTSAYVSKEVVLQDNMDAVGLKVLLSAYRPIGTNIDVYGRFTFTSNVETKSNWIKLTNASPDLYSSDVNVKDYKDFEYNLDESDEDEFASFQLKIVLRHSTQGELNGSNTTPNINKFPHIYDYRAIALT